MIVRVRLGSMRRCLAWVLAVLATMTPASASLRLQTDGALQIAGRAVKCGSIRNVLDPDLPNLGTTSRRRNVLTLNPERLERYPSTVALFVFHHECGHHHVGSDELEADCWAVYRGIRDGWLERGHLRSICRSFGNRPETATHPAGDERCASLHQCFAAASAAVRREARTPQRSEVSAFAERRPLHAAAPSTPRVEAPPLPVGTLLLLFVALVLTAAPRRRRSFVAQTVTSP